MPSARSPFAAPASAAPAPGSAKYAGQTRRICSSASSSSAAPAVVSSSSSRARSRTSSGVRRNISSSNSGQRPSPTEPSGSTASTPSRRSGNASATCRARCPPHEWPTTYAFSQPSASRTRRASPTSVATVYGPSAADGSSPRCWYQATSFSSRELVGEIAEVVEAEPRPAVQQENRRPAAGAATRDQRPIVVRRELRPRHDADPLTPPRGVRGARGTTSRCPCFPTARGGGSTTTFEQEDCGASQLHQDQP